MGVDENTFLGSATCEQRLECFCDCANSTRSKTRNCRLTRASQDKSPHRHHIKYSEILVYMITTGIHAYHYSRYCSKTYLCIAILFLIIIPVLILGYILYSWRIMSASSMFLVFLILFTTIVFGYVLIIIPRILYCIISLFYFHKIHINNLKSNLLLRFICSDYFFDDVSRRIHINKPDKDSIIDFVVQIIFFIIVLTIIISFYITHS